MYNSFKQNQLSQIYFLFSAIKRQNKLEFFPFDYFDKDLPDRLNHGLVLFKN